MEQLRKLCVMENSYLEEKLEALVDGHLHVSSHCSAALKKSNVVPRCVCKKWDCPCPQWFLCQLTSKRTHQNTCSFFKFSVSETMSLSIRNFRQNM